MSNLHKMTNPWLNSLDTDDIITLRDNLDWMQSRLFNQYEPDWYETFDDKIARWLENLPTDAEQMTLFRLLEHLFFVGKAQFDSLSRAAFNDTIKRWIVDIIAVNIDDVRLSDAIQARIEDTWFCPITDSMRINSFLKLNNLKGHDYRPDWRSLSNFGSSEKIRQYINLNSIKGLVLLEDFVGGGSQMKTAVEFAAVEHSSLPILVIPLVCCPDGLVTGQQLERDYSNLKFAPILSLRESLFIKPTRSPGEPAIFDEIRKIVSRQKNRFGEWATDPYGWDDTGAVVALFTNCPDNSLPLLFHKGASWNALFSRMRRG